MENQTVYLVTGANRGIGHALLVHLLARPNTTVIATVRDPAFAPLQLPKATGSALIILSLDIATPADYLKLGSSLTASKISHIDVVIANAGMHQNFLSISDTSADQLLSVFQANAVGPILLFQSLWHFLAQSSKREGGIHGPKFFVMSSVLGSISCQSSGVEKSLSYGISKCAANYFVRKAHFEYEESGLICAALDPGWVQTAMGQDFADSLGFKEPPLTMDESVTGLLEQIDGATRESAGGKFVRWDGTIVSW